MSLSFDKFVSAFLKKITTYEYLELPQPTRDEIVHSYMMYAMSGFRRVCKYDIMSSLNEMDECFDIDIPETDLWEIIDIVSDGMIVHWLKPHLYKQELMQNALNTRDFTSHSPAELLLRIGNAYDRARNEYIQKVREYSYNSGDLTSLHL